MQRVDDMVHYPQGGPVGVQPGTSPFRNFVKEAVQLGGGHGPLPKDIRAAGQPGPLPTLNPTDMGD
eukprot:4186216-Karenia_brevis.AAC.1